MINRGLINPSGHKICSGDPSRAHPKGRVCEEEGCDTVLSIYNSTKYCATHAIKHPIYASGRAKKTRTVKVV